MYTCSICGKKFAKAADMYQCMAEDCKKKITEAKQAEDIDTRLCAYEDNILVAANKLKDAIANYNNYARHNSRETYKGRLEISTDTRKIAQSFISTPTIQSIKLRQFLLNLPPRTCCSCKSCTCDKEKEVTEDSIHDIDYWKSKGIVDEVVKFGKLLGVPMTKEEALEGLESALKDPTIQEQIDDILNSTSPESFDEYLTKILGI